MSDTPGTDLLDRPDDGATHSDAVAAEVPPPAAATPPPPPEPVVQHHARAGAAICALAAGALHLVAMADHMDHHAAVGRAFLAVAALQALWAVLLVRTRSRTVVVAGMALMAAAIVVWILSRTQGISWFPGLEAVEPFGWRDVTAQAFQLLALVAGTLLLLPARLFAPPAAADDRSPVPVVVMGVLAIAVVAWVYAATHGQVHHA